MHLKLQVGSSAARVAASFAVGARGSSGCPKVAVSRPLCFAHGYVEVIENAHACIGNEATVSIDQLPLSTQRLRPRRFLLPSATTCKALLPHTHPNQAVGRSRPDDHDRDTSAGRSPCTCIFPGSCARPSHAPPRPVVSARRERRGVGHWRRSGGMSSGSMLFGARGWWDVRK